MERPTAPFWLPDTSQLPQSGLSSSVPAIAVGPLGWRVALLAAYALSLATTIVLSLRAFRRQYSTLHSIGWNRAFLAMSLIAMLCLPHTHTHTQDSQPHEALLFFFSWVGGAQ